MSNTIILKSDIVEEILFTFGTAMNFAKEASLSPATVSSILKGKTAGAKARTSFVKTLNKRREEGSKYEQKDIFKMVPKKNTPTL